MRFPRTRAILLGWFIVALAFPQRAWAVSTTEGTDGTSGPSGAAQKDVTRISSTHPSGQVFCSQSARGAIVTLPSGYNITLNSCSSSTLATTDICTNTAGGCPVIGTDSKLSTSIIPDMSGTLAPVYWIPGSLTGTGSITATAVAATSTSTTTRTVTATATGTGTCAGTGTVTGTQTVSGTASVTVIGTGTSSVTVTGIGTGSSTTTEINVSVGNASAAPAPLSVGSSGQALFNPSGGLEAATIKAGFGGTNYVPLMLRNSIIGFNYDSGGKYMHGYYYAGAIVFGPSNGQILFYNSPMGTAGTSAAIVSRMAVCPGGEIDIGNNTCGNYLLRVGASLAGFDASANVFAPNITTTPTAYAIPKAGADGKIDLGWIPSITSSGTSTDTGTGNAGYIPRFVTYTATSTQTSTVTYTVTRTALGNSIMSDNASTISIGGDIAANNITITPGASKVVKSGTDSKIDVNWLPVGSSAGTVAAGDDSRIVNALQTSAVSGSDVLVDVSSGAITGTHALTSANVTAALTYTPMSNTVTHLSGDIATSTISGTNVTVDVLSGAITATHTSGGMATLPAPYYTATGNLTVSGTMTKTASYSATVTGTWTATATLTGTGTGAGTGTLTGTGTISTTGYATVARTATGTGTVTVTGTGYGTSTITETNASIGNASAAAGMFNVGTANQTYWDPQGNEVSSGTITLTGAGPLLSAGTNGRSIGMSSSSTYALIGLNSRPSGSGDTPYYGPGSANQYASEIMFNPNSGSFSLTRSLTPGWSGQSYMRTSLVNLTPTTATFPGSIVAGNISTTPTAFFIPEALSTGLLAPGWIPPPTVLASNGGTVTINTSVPTSIGQACITTGAGSATSCTWQSVLTTNGVSGSNVTACDYANGQCTAIKTATTTGTLYAGPGMNFTTGTGTGTATATSCALSGGCTLNVTSTSTSTSTVTATLYAGAGIGFKTNTTTSTYSSCSIPGPCTMLQTSTATGTNTFSPSNAIKGSFANGLLTSTSVMLSSDIATAGGLVTNGITGTATYPTAISVLNGQVTSYTSGSAPTGGIIGSGVTGYMSYFNSSSSITASGLHVSGSDLYAEGDVSPNSAYSGNLGDASHPWDGMTCSTAFVDNLVVNGTYATETPTAHAPVVADSGGTVNAWVTNNVPKSHPLNVLGINYVTNLSCTNTSRTVWVSCGGTTNTYSPNASTIEVTSNATVSAAGGRCAVRLVKVVGGTTTQISMPYNSAVEPTGYGISYANVSSIATTSATATSVDAYYLQILSLDLDTCFIPADGGSMIVKTYGQL